MRRSARVSAPCARDTPRSRNASSRERCNLTRPTPRLPSLLAQIQKDRQRREREQRLKEGLSQAENLLSGEKFDEAQRRLTELQQAYPDAEEVQQKLQALNQKAAAPAPPPSPSAAAVRAPMRDAAPSDASKSMQFAEELRRRLQTPRPPDTAPPAKTPTPALTSTPPVTQAPAPATSVTEAPKAKPVADKRRSTLVMGSSPDVQLPEEPKASEEPPPPSAPKS